MFLRLSVWLTALAAFALWVVFVSGFKGQEMLVGGICTAACTAFLVFAWKARPVHLEFHAADVRQGWRVPGSIVQDAWVVCRALARDLSGRRVDSALTVHPFEASTTNRRKRAREVLVVTYLTASPNSIVLGVDQEAGLLLMHQLDPQALPETARRLGASEAA